MKYVYYIDGEKVCYEEFNETLYCALVHDMEEEFALLVSKMKPCKIGPFELDIVPKDKDDLFDDITGYGGYCVWIYDALVPKLRETGESVVFERMRFEVKEED